MNCPALLLLLSLLQVIHGLREKTPVLRRTFPPPPRRTSVLPRGLEPKRIFRPPQLIPVPRQPPLDLDFGGFDPVMEDTEVGMMEDEVEVDVEEEDDDGEVPLTKVQCTSFPGDDPNSNKLYFRCSCRDRYGDSKFSLAEFVSDLSATIFDRNLEMDFRDCWSLSLAVDEDDLYRVDSTRFRPDLYISNVYIENVVEVYLSGKQSADPGYNNSFFPDYIRMAPDSLITITLYDVERVHLQSNLNVDLLQTETADTTVVVEMINGTESGPRLRGFQASKILVAGATGRLLQGNKDEFLHVLSSIEESMSVKSEAMSLILAGCVCIVVVGVGVAIFAIAKRNQYLIQAVVYSSLDSLRRSYKFSDPENNISSDIITTTTKVNFFPKYSVVKKENSAAQRGKPTKKKVEKETTKEKEPEETGDKSERMYSSLASKIYQIPSISELLAKVERPFGNAKRTMKLAKETEVDRDKTSFYFQTHSDTSASSKSDLTAGKTLKTEAEVHRGASPPPAAGEEDYRGASPASGGGAESATKEVEQEDVLKSTSPQPLLGSDNKYSFVYIRDKCRRLINFQNNTKL